MEHALAPQTLWAIQALVQYRSFSFGREHYSRLIWGFVVASVRAIIYSCLHPSRNRSRTSLGRALPVTTGVRQERVHSYCIHFSNEEFIIIMVTARDCCFLDASRGVRAFCQLDCCVCEQKD